MAKSLPILPKSLFKLVVRLDNKKYGNADTNALEELFQVPKEYALDDAALRRQDCDLYSTSPGPGSYNVSSKQLELPYMIGRASFLSKTKRDGLGIAALENKIEVEGTNPTSGVVITYPTDISYNVVRNNVGRKQVRSKSEKKRSKVMTRPQEPKKLNNFQKGSGQASLTDVGTKIYQPHCKSNFSRAKRDVGYAREQLINIVGPPFNKAVSIYDEVNRDNHTGQKLSDALFSSKAFSFGNSNQDRRLTWTPALTYFTNAQASGWSDSIHYQKQRRLLDKHYEINTRRNKSVQLPVEVAKEIIPDVECEEFDPFEWLRKQPHGENRVNKIAIKHGLINCTRPISNITVGYDIPANETQLAIVAPDNVNELLSKAIVTESASITDSKDFIYHKQERISITCRLPGGSVVTIRTYIDKKLHHLKKKIVQKQKRYSNELEFELYLPNGRKLSDTETSLGDYGLADRSSVLLVPTTHYN